MYADDTFVVAFTSIWLLKHQKDLETYCKKWNLTVNVQTNKGYDFQQM